ncbi:MAG: phage holin family protein [Chloroflexi bacterium]|nr:phage holin family protein [Chloroflexota bacterium]
MEARREPKLVSLAFRLGINAAALWLASEWVRGFEIDGGLALLAMAVIFAVVNALIRPVAQLIGCPLSCLTLGLFVLVINAAMLALSVWIAGRLDLDVEIEGFVAAFLAALLISVVSATLNMLGRPLRWALR